VAEQDGGSWSRALAGHRAAQEEAILAAALRLLDRRGLAGITMSALAEEAGISRPTLYHYFPDVDSVLAAWVGREVSRGVALLVARAEGIADPVQRIAQLVADQCAVFASQEHRLGAEHFESETVAPAVRRQVTRSMAPLRQLLARTLAEAAGQGALRVDVAPDLAADLILGLLGAVRRHLVDGTIDPAAAAAAVLGVLFRGWKPAGRRGSGR
jgi:AcrR family transcriptional regulator